MDEKTTKQVLQFQQDEITGEILYGRLAQVCKDEKNGEVLRKMSEAEGSHYRFWRV
jgi:hypothetical protein